MEQNKGRKFVKARKRISGRERTTQRVADLCASQLSQFEIALDRMLAPIHFGRATVKKSRAFARIAHSVNLFRAAYPRDKRAPQQSLKIERQIGAQFSRFSEPRHHADGRAESGEIAARENVNMIHVRISAEQRREFRIHHPRDFRFRMRVTNRRHRRQRVNDVPERARFDD